MQNLHQHSKPEYKESILKVLNYINQNLTDELSLETLAQVANYSKFHFLKIFSELMSESPKQYIIRLRLEKAAHHRRIFRDLPVSEIALNSGFSSPSVFSRAFKNYFGITAEELGNISCDKMQTIPELSDKGSRIFRVDEEGHWIDRICDSKERISRIQITPPPEVKTLKSTKIAYIQTTINQKENIAFAFKSIVKWAIPRELLFPDSKFIGIWLDLPFYTAPDKCRYLAGIELNTEFKPYKGIDILTIPEGKYANFSMVGNLESTLDNLLALVGHYLPEIGYEVKEPICYEIFDESPAHKPFDLISKNILLPVKAQ